MSDYTLSTEDVRIACEMAISGLYPSAARRGAFDRWLGQVKAEAWDEGYTSGKSNIMRRMSDEPKAPLTRNPYRQEQEA